MIRNIRKGILTVSATLVIGGAAQTANSQNNGFDNLIPPSYDQPYYTSIGSPFDACHGLVTTEAKALNVRSGPSIESAVVAKLPKGNSVTALTCYREWCQVHDIDNGLPIGWSSRKFLRCPTTGYGSIQPAMAMAPTVGAKIAAPAVQPTSATLQLPQSKPHGGLSTSDTASQLATLINTVSLLDDQLLSSEDRKREFDRLIRQNELMSRLAQEILRSSLLGSSMIAGDTTNGVTGELFNIPSSSTVTYGGSRQSITLTELQDAIDLIKSREGYLGTYDK